MKSLFLFVLLLTAFLCQSQTKVIAHKSHSGSKKSFVKAYQNNLFDIKRSNFGLPNNRNIVVLDKVVALNDSLTVLFMRESDVCYSFETSYTDLKKSDFKSKTDTLKNHKIYKKSNSATFIKSSGVRPVRFDNPIDDVRFVGFRN
jgi:hypothetical protein